MSRRLLQFWLLAALGWLLLFASVYLGCKRWQSWAAEPLRELVLVALAIPTAVLAAAFNRRNSYLQALRDFWRQLIPAVQQAIQYTHLPHPDQAAFAKVSEGLTSAIDLTRGVFANIHTARGGVGLYPFENLKDINNIISWLGFGGTFKDDKRATARRCITRLWQEMHDALLREFDRDVPLRPVSKHLHKGQSIADLLIADQLRPTDFEQPASHPRGTGNQLAERAKPALRAG